MSCDQLRDHYEMYAIGLADEPERSEIREHLDRGCEVCMSEMRRARELAALLGGTATLSVPSPKLRRRLLASVGFEQRSFGWAPFLAAALALSLFAVVYFSGREKQFAQEATNLREQMRRQSIDLTRLNEAFAILNSPGTTETSFGTGQPKPPKGRIFVNPRQGVLLIASDLPPAPKGKAYEMWTIPKAGKPAPAGLFQSQTDGTAMHVWRAAVDIASTGAVAVTLEDEAGALQPTTTPLIVAPML